MATAWPQSKPGVPGPYRPVGQSVFGSQAFSLFCPSPKDDIDTETELRLSLRILDAIPVGYHHLNLVPLK